MAKFVQGNDLPYSSPACFCAQKMLYFECSDSGGADRQVFPGPSAIRSWMGRLSSRLGERFDGVLTGAMRNLLDQGGEAKELLVVRLAGEPGMCGDAYWQG